MPSPDAPPDASHAHWMARCLELARRGAGRVSPNPMVGAVLVGPHGEVLGEGHHARYGGPHAEVAAVGEALRRSEAPLDRATLYVNLEPCDHYGKTPPCTDLLLRHGIPRVIVGMEDPFPEVAGRGIARLREAGVDVTVGVLDRRCRRLNEAFVHHVRTGRPLVTLKVAQTLDGRVATATGDSRWVSGLPARARVHRWRAETDAVLVGRGTAAADDPALTVRHPEEAGPAGEARQPVRVVLDRPGALAPTLKLFADRFADHTLALVGPGVRPRYDHALAARGGRLWRVPVAASGHFDLGEVLDRLGREGGSDGRPLQSVLVEAGPGLATALFRHDLVDRFYLFVAPRLVGTGTPALAELGVERMAEALTFVQQTWEPIGDDLLFRGFRRALSG